jgi:hypothetical protein
MDDDENTPRDVGQDLVATIVSSYVKHNTVSAGDLLDGPLTPIRPPLRDRKFADSLLEESGFELTVPPTSQHRR